MIRSRAKYISVSGPFVLPDHPHTLKPGCKFGAMGSTCFLGFSCPNLLLVFLNLLFLETCIIFFSPVLGLSLGLFYLFIYLFPVPYFGLFMTTEICFFALKSKKEKVLDRGQNGFECDDNNNNNTWASALTHRNTSPFARWFCLP